ncbi:hypothetical protein HaLaN_05882 [Haematococcus lacustris]|uniref:Uncharacterized protein n=1 Tax=Haematococcus lacustris TaxID=44745 RepID=A0A699YM13_HAELA|nr:hypothetical protein HaLaN_05882 [Haematococcus lacustris]
MQEFDAREVTKRGAKGWPGPVWGTRTGASNRLLQVDRNKRPGGLAAVQLLLTGLGAVHS